MKKLVLALFVITMAVSCGKDLPKNRVIAHRGFWVAEGSAQNSLTSLRLAMDNGFYGSECDIQLTADSCFIVFHDSRLHGEYLENLTFEQILADTTLVNGERISTVDEYFEAFASHGGDTKLIIEVKPQVTEDMMSLSIARTAEAIKKFNIQDRVEIISFSYRACKELAAIFPEIPVSFLDETHNVSFEQMKADGIDGIDYEYHCILDNPDLIEEAHAIGFIVDVWTANDPDEVLTMVEAGLDYVTTNRPDLMLEILQGI